MAEDKKIKLKAPRNRTLELSQKEIKSLKKQLVKLDKPASLLEIENKTINQDIFEALNYLPNSFIDLLVVDPPYNLDKKFNQSSFKKMENEDYENWLDSWISKIVRLLKSTTSIYICGDWKSSAAIFNVAGKYFKTQNRITWEREKGRGANSNWKNCSEDIWFFTMSKNYHFDINAIKVKRKVLAPYKDEDGKPKDWQKDENGKFRETHPSNIWTDITVPFWSMPENTEHPTQKPEKLIAKIILASSKPGEIVFDPFLGSGTTSVVAKKLNRKFVGIEIDPYYCCLAEKRLEIAEQNKTIQGYEKGIFWERNSLNKQNNPKNLIFDYNCNQMPLLNY